MAHGHLRNVDVTGALSLATHSKLHLARLARKLMQRVFLAFAFSAACTVYIKDKNGSQLDIDMGGA